MKQSDQLYNIIMHIINFYSISSNMECMAGESSNIGEFRGTVDPDCDEQTFVAGSATGSLRGAAGGRAPALHCHWHDWQWIVLQCKDRCKQVFEKTGQWTMDSGRLHHSPPLPDEARINNLNHICHYPLL
jgi:hypothetical protein